MQIDIEHIKRAIGLLKAPDELYEIRILQGKSTLSGYFKGVENLDKAFKTVKLEGSNVFITLNKINDACYSRTQHECFRQEKITTSDGDITAYKWFLVDIDPKRPSGVSSTEEELKSAKIVAGKVYKYLQDRDFKEPIIAKSGNGLHLLYSIALNNNEENKNLIERCLKALDFLFSNDEVSIDTSVFNPSRISKLYGTMAQKGAHTENRPHRMSKIYREPFQIEQTGKDVLKALANEYPDDADKPAQRMSKRYVQNEFNLDQWLSDNMIRVHEIKKWKDATRYVLEECPFDGSHKAPDSTIIKMANGAIAFKCLHNSCAGRTWQDLRLKYEPDAYDDKQSAIDERIEQGWAKHKAYNRNLEVPTVKVETVENPKWETVSHILSKPKEIRVTIPTGTREIDKSIGGGLAKGEISVISGLRASAKSTWLSQIALNAVDKEYNVLFFSGELKDIRFVDWLLCQAAGIDNIDFSREYENIAWPKSKEISQRIADWIGGKLRLYDNTFGMDFKEIKEDLKQRIVEYRSDLVILDNLAILDLSSYKDNGWGSDMYEAQKQFIKDLKDMSIQYNCHICFVAHPRKSLGFLRLDDIAGSSNIGNLVDSAFIMHRNNQDFMTKFCQFFDNRKFDELRNASNILEIAKDRECGAQDKFVPLWYENGTRRMRNYDGERIRYGWESQI